MGSVPPSDLLYLHRILRESPDSVTVAPPTTTGNGTSTGAGSGTSTGTGTGSTTGDGTATGALGPFPTSQAPATSRAFFHQVCDAIRDTDRCVLGTVQSFLYAYAARPGTS